jgi:hypothetical protein
MKLVSKKDWILIDDKQSRPRILCLDNFLDENYSIDLC